MIEKGIATKVLVIISSKLSICNNKRNYDKEIQLEILSECRYTEKCFNSNKHNYTREMEFNYILEFERLARKYYYMTFGINFA
jgi:hypothetical protein